jgi:hypothetical protein
MPPLNIFPNSSEAIRTILDLHFPTGRIIDVNYSLGVFYKNVQREIIGVDIRPVAAVRADNRYLPFPSNSFEIGVADPPYKRGPGDARYTDRFGLAPYTTKRVDQQYFDLIPELLRVCTAGIILKAQDDTDGHRFNHRLFKITSFMKEQTGLDPHDVAYIVRPGVPENNINSLHNERHFLANCISYFLIYRWAAKDPFKAFRFGKSRTRQVIKETHA